ncbi:Bug family tripartite tricarboxylate transporter substrate binding protein [uncultured Enterovirga sp.]|uniref:Bug family tripartite tricarboxylate transporter substrate binding protein n=1 Tax=uncultured Enterovirga sp. TaxID=2026352 RepID=UPI0035C9AEF8
MAAQTYPGRTVVLSVPTPPGGQPDILARLVADRLSKALPQRLVVENRAGANSNISPREVARAAPDGHTLLVASAPFLINTSLYTDLAFDPIRDFVPVAMLGAAPSILIVHPSVPAKTLAEFVDYLRQSAGKPIYASPGAGTASRLLFEQFKRLAGVEPGIVPYRGAGPVFNDVLAGHVPMTIAQVEVAAAMVREGRLRALAVSSRERSALLPDVPTFRELGFPIEVTVWSGLYAPAGTPPAIVELLNAETRKALAEPAARDVMGKLGIVSEPLTPAQLGDLVRAEIARYAGIVKAAGITVDQ